MRLNRFPVAGCCFLLALSVITLTSFSPASLNSYKESNFQFLPRDEPHGRAAPSKQVWINSIPSIAQQAWHFSERKWTNPLGRQALSNPSSVCKQKRRQSNQGGPNHRSLQGRRKDNGQLRKHNIVSKSSEHPQRFQHKGYPSRTNYKMKRELGAFTLKNPREDNSFSPHWRTGKEVDWKAQTPVAFFSSPLRDESLLLLQNTSTDQLIVPQEQCKTDVQTAGAKHQPSDLIKAVISGKRPFQTMTSTWGWMDKSHSWGPQSTHIWVRDAEALQKSGLCKKPQDSGHLVKQEGRLRLHENILPWFTLDDVHKMKFLANGTVVNKERIPAHGQILRVTLSSNQDVHSHDSKSPCLKGLCGLIKRPTDLYEVLAFHLDRVLGLHRSLPMVARKFSSPLLPYKYTNGAPRPIVWWVPDMQHLNDSNNDQNSFALGWKQYQVLLKQRCGMEGSGTSLGKPPCLTVLHSEWAKLALFDFLLQVDLVIEQLYSFFSLKGSS